MFNLWPKAPSLPAAANHYRVETQPRTLRDEFAMAALAHGLPQWYRGAVRGQIADRYDHAAEQAYAVADAMLRAREKPPTE